MVSLLFCPSLRAEDPPASDRTSDVRTVVGRTMVVIPFQNASPTPSLEWLGESFPQTFHEQLNSPLLYVASRDERLRAYDRQGVPAGVHPSRAPLYRLAEQMDVDYTVLAIILIGAEHGVIDIHLLGDSAQDGPPLPLGPQP